MRAGAAMAESMVRQGTWVPVCRLDQLRVDVGIAALVEGEQVAMFRLDDEEVLAIGNLDPYSWANVLSRGIVGSRGDAVFVASPMFKQPFDLRTGECLDDPEVSVPTYDVRVVDGIVQVMAPPQIPNRGVAVVVRGALDLQHGDMQNRDRKPPDG